MRDLVLFGIQGSGKGTQGKLLAAKFGYKIFETGSELRNLAKLTTPLALKVKSIIDAGNLVSDEVVMEIVENFLEGLSSEQRVLFDGIPRKESQAVLFDALMKKVERRPLGVYINLVETDALKRLSVRRICQTCQKTFPADYTLETCDLDGAALVTRADDNPESIKKRFTNYSMETMPVIERYRTRKNLIEVQGNHEISDVFASITESLPA